MSALPIVEAPLFFLDYDGTLASIVDDPMEAYPHEAVQELLPMLAERYPLWIVTGRYLQDLDALLGLPLPAIGLHGLQEGTIGGAVEDLMPEEARAAIASLRASVPSLAGLRIEPKGPTFAVHYRGVADEAAALEALDRWAATVPPVLGVVRGKKVIEVRPEGFSKGVSVRRLAEEHPGRTPVYLGDDVTDEDAFAALGDAAVTVKVGDGPTRARYRLPDVEAVVAYLRRYV